MHDLTKVHQAELAILKEIDRICRKYKLRYLLDSGTLIGAVRHQGFIPWDDDADVAMTRASFDGFLKVAPRELPKTMELVMPGQLHGGKGFYDFTPKIIYKNSQIHEESAETAFYDGKLDKLSVDLFVLDALPDGRARAAVAKALQAGIYGLAMGHRYRLDYKKYAPLTRIMVAAMAGVGRLIPLSWLVKLQDVLAKKDRKKKTARLYYSNYQPDYLYVTLERDWSVETVELPFEGEHFMCPKGWDHVLTWVYGDYRTLPPVEKRKPTHATAEIWVDVEG